VLPQVGAELLAIRCTIIRNLRWLSAGLEKAQAQRCGWRLPKDIKPDEHRKAATAARNCSGNMPINPRRKFGESRILT
jgi:hypothetical protein